MKHKLNMSPEDVYESIGKHVSYASKLMMWNGSEDGTRTDMDYMCKTVELASRTELQLLIFLIWSLYDTSEFTKYYTLLNKVPNIDKAILSTHCHNDLGLQWQIFWLEFRQVLDKLNVQLMA